MCRQPQVAPVFLGLSINSSHLQDFAYIFGPNANGFVKLETQTDGNELVCFTVRSASGAAMMVTTDHSVARITSRVTCYLKLHPVEWRMSMPQLLQQRAPYSCCDWVRASGTEKVTRGSYQPQLSFRHLLPLHTVLRVLSQRFYDLRMPISYHLRLSSFSNAFCNPRPFTVVE